MTAAAKKISLPAPKSDRPPPLGGRRGPQGNHTRLLDVGHYLSAGRIRNELKPEVSGSIARKSR